MRERVVALICPPPIKNKLSMPYVQLANDIMPTSSVARNSVVSFDDALNMNSHVQHMCRMAYFHPHSRAYWMNSKYSTSENHRDDGVYLRDVSSWQWKWPVVRNL